LAIDRGRLMGDPFIVRGYQGQCQVPG